MSRAIRLIDDGALEQRGVEALAARLGVTAGHLRRLFRHHLGATPVRLARAPYLCRLPYRPPYDWAAALAFLRLRAIPGVEDVTDAAYRRTVRVGESVGTLEVSHESASSVLILTAHLPAPTALFTVVDRTRRMFDLGANTLAVSGDLRPEPLLRATLDAHPGLRVMGAWDGFEVAVRAVLGQQISVRAATTLAGRLASAFGMRVEADDRLTTMFPTAAELTHARSEEVGVMPTRAETIRLLARRVADGVIDLDDAMGSGRTIAALREVPGIGDWTAQYIAMRAFADPDAFPSSDLIVRREAGGLSAPDLERRAETWRPWRAYAVMLMWRGASDAAELTGAASRTDGPSRRLRP